MYIIAFSWGIIIHMFQIWVKLRVNENYFIGFMSDFDSTNHFVGFELIFIGFFAFESNSTKPVYLYRGLYRSKI